MRLGIDTGGTYTDAVLYDPEKGIVRSAKALTTHHDLGICIKNVIEKIDADKGFVLSDVVDFTSLSTTLATNAIVEGHGGSVCLLLIGHDHASLNRSGLKSSLGDAPVEFIKGGHTALGEQAQDLDIVFARQAIEQHKDTVSAFAIAGIFSVRNSEHEIAIRDLILELTQKPVTCSFELTAELDSPRRAMTAVLNARLIAPISELIRSVKTELQNRNITSPLMVVKGDGSMIGADLAVQRPVETILSGPAASIVGACHLAKSKVSVVSDIGGTTTDIATVVNGVPSISRRGATVGGFRTFVEAVDAYTVGIGGDSEVSVTKPVRVGPQRAIPLCSLTKRYPEIIDVLEDQLGRAVSEYQGSFAVRRRNLVHSAQLGRSEAKLWALLEAGPVAYEELFKDLHLFRAFGRLRNLGLVSLSTFTPTDALHVLGKVQRWPKEASVLGASIWTRGFIRGAKPVWNSTNEFCEAVVEAVVRQTCEAVIKAVLTSESQGNSPPVVEPKLLDMALQNSPSGLLNIQFSIDGQLATVGAPAHYFYHEVSRKLNTKLIIPEYFEVGNAVGTVAGGISQRVGGLVTSPQEGVYRAHTPRGIKDFNKLETAAEFVQEILSSIALKRAEDSNAVKPELTIERHDNVVRVGIDASLFVESRITATARSAA